MVESWTEGFKVSQGHGTGGVARREAESTSDALGKAAFAATAHGARGTRSGNQDSSYVRYCSLLHMLVQH